jgi:hypothetical protein
MSLSINAPSGERIDRPAWQTAIDPHASRNGNLGNVELVGESTAVQATDEVINRHAVDQNGESRFG